MTVPHPMQRPDCECSLQVGAIGGADKFPLVKTLSVIVIETGDRRMFYTTDGLFLGAVHYQENQE